ncbi:MAG: hypothetical protein LIP11_18620 [Clostridiales bacterium]|nr:hypothetical protein [Clostridiales bacterium]
MGFEGWDISRESDQRDRKELLEQTELLQGYEQTELEDLLNCVGMDEVFEANEHAEDGNSDAVLGDAASDLKNLQRKLEVAEQNLEHARKRLKSLISAPNTPETLIRDREYQIKQYTKEIEKLSKEIKREQAQLENT